MNPIHKQSLFCNIFVTSFVNMELSITSKQDTVKTLNLIEGLPGQVIQGNTNVQATPSTVLEGNSQEETTIQSGTTQTVQRQTVQQLRYLERQRENKLLVGGSRYMEPKNEILLISSVDVNVKKIGLPYREKAVNSTDWLTIVLLLGLVLFATVKNSFSKYLNYLMQSVFIYSTARRMFQEKNNSVFQASIRMELFFYLTMSVFLYQLANHFRIELSYGKFFLYLICLGLVIVYYFVKILLYRFVGSVTEGKQETSEYLFNMSNFNRIAGIFIFPVVTFIAFNPFENIDIVIIAGILVLSGFYILLISRGIGILLKKQFSIFYLFLYLCTLEFLPLLLIYKIVVV
jgi:hypothetical protein